MWVLLLLRYCSIYVHSHIILSYIVHFQYTWQRDPRRYARKGPNTYKLLSLATDKEAANAVFLMLAHMLSAIGDHLYFFNITFGVRYHAGTLCQSVMSICQFKSRVYIPYQSYVTKEVVKFVCACSMQEKVCKFKACKKTPKSKIIVNFGRFFRVDWTACHLTRPPMVMQFKLWVISSFVEFYS